MECKGEGRPEKICHGNSGSISSLSAGDQGFQIHKVYSQSACGTHSGAMQHPTRPWLQNQSLGAEFLWRIGEVLIKPRARIASGVLRK